MTLETGKGDFESLDGSYFKHLEINHQSLQKSQSKLTKESLRVEHQILEVLQYNSQTAVKLIQLVLEQGNRKTLMARRS